MRTAGCSTESLSAKNSSTMVDAYPRARHQLIAVPAAVSCAGRSGNHVRPGKIPSGAVSVRGIGRAEGWLEGEGDTTTQSGTPRGTPRSAPAATLRRVLPGMDEACSERYSAENLPRVHTQN